MKVKEFQTLLGRLAKANPEQEIIIGFPTVVGNAWVPPAVVKGKDALYIVPEEAETNLEADVGRDKVGEELTRMHKQDQQQGDTA